MSPVSISVVLVIALLGFTVSVTRRWRQLTAGAPLGESRWDQWPRRLRLVLRLGFAQTRMHQYPLAGLAHQLIFLGFLVLLVRSLVLIGRGYDPAFSAWVLDSGTPLGIAYGLLKDAFIVAVLGGTGVFFYLRTIRPARRMTLSREGLLILAIIATMMLAEVAYDGAGLALAEAHAPFEQATTWWGPLASAVAAPHTGLAAGARLAHPLGHIAAQVLVGWDGWALAVLGQAGYWAHLLLVLLFLNLLPHSKHFHVLTALPNLFTTSLAPPGRLPRLASSLDELLEKIEAAADLPDESEARLGYARLSHLTWKDRLDLFTCTECGRCSEHCPATRTGKSLNPKALTVKLRDAMYGRPAERGELTPNALPSGGEGPAPASASAPTPLLVPHLVSEQELWACTTCRACEEQCPVGISYVDKIVQMRRHLVVVRGDVPRELERPYEALELNGNPWNLSQEDRLVWARGLNVKTIADAPESKTLLWVGCAGAYDSRARAIARATAQLLEMAGEDFAVLGAEERCTGDAARRSGNEYLFTLLAQQNIATLDGYRDAGGIERIVTLCPHCYNTLANEYPEFGGNYRVLHHSELLLELVEQGRLQPRKRKRQTVTYHDACYLTRYNGRGAPPRALLESLPGLELVEPELSGKRAMCCGAGGAQMWLEEQNRDRINDSRAAQLIATGADTIASACPFCMTMLSDGLESAEVPRGRARDLAEILLDACSDPTGAAEAHPGGPA